ncbi:GntR family transcriptional regulator [Bianquea renquensis]|uniref:GntR family transcriptional regulator n=1 Tax=Bianquea renquensis TaxID=2763661 RepID=A0A926DQ35_9FIRM|nr:GntR family transcriptional regulator [Bianquea renquensis]MBC8541993.1 GntR family transcriptional regulator [Bianquea renquensis]
MREDRPLYKKIQDELLQSIMIGSLRPGEKVPSEHQYAERLKVNRLTVRKAYASLIKEEILIAEQGRGTFVATHAKQKIRQLDPLEWGDYSSVREMKLMLLFPDRYFYPRIIARFIETAGAQGYIVNASMNDTLEKESEAIDILKREEYLGVVISPLRIPSFHSWRNFEKLDQMRIPYVMLGNPPFGISCPSVICNDSVSVYKAALKLIQKGHRNLLYVSDRAKEDEEAGSERFEGFRRAIEERFGRARIYTIDIAKGGASAILSAIRERQITAVVSSKESLGLQLYSMLTLSGYTIPDMIELVAYDMAEFSEQVNSIISTIEVPKEQMADACFDLLMEEIRRADMLAGELENKRDYVKQYIFEADLKEK